MSGAVTVQKLRRDTARSLRVAGIESAELDARVLIAHVLELDAAQLLAADGAVEERAQLQLSGLVARRIAGEPVARIVGVKEFWSRAFSVSPDVLVPRPETETVVEASLRAKPDRDAPLRVLDLGVGSGALLGAILLERPHASGVGIDRSFGALAMARKNLDALGVGGRAHFICGDWGCAIDERFDLVVANPPYITSDEIAALPREVRDHDPAGALDGGADGLDAYRQIVAGLPYWLAPGGVAVLELGKDQEGAVTALARIAGIIINGRAQSDLSGLPRALVLSVGGDKITLGRADDPH